MNICDGLVELYITRIAIKKTIFKIRSLRKGLTVNTKRLNEHTKSHLEDEGRSEKSCVISYQILKKVFIFMRELFSKQKLHFLTQFFFAGNNVSLTISKNRLFVRTISFKMKPCSSQSIKNYA